MNGFHRPNPTDSHAELSTGSMAEMRALIDRQAESIRQLAQERDAFRNALLDLGVPPDLLDPAVLASYRDSLKGLPARVTELEQGHAVTKLELAITEAALELALLQPSPVITWQDLLDMKAALKAEVQKRKEQG
ncbi:MAG: hypothetical protein CVV27_08450 [Candidatus Melainabacteria bacterium HGW-Melainabacteria-1]|nr:MAG: hypothetical protein CVV27_08450 [Candidatus Melainabacteria bacterium HGW-Melainabacteria-1]